MPAHAPIEPRWLTVEQAAAASGFTTRTIRDKIKDGDLIAYKPRGSRVLRIHPGDLDAMITGGQESLAARIRRVLADHGGTIPDATDEQIRAAARLLPLPAPRGNGAHDAP
jgi:excisionase family DNA binding protein